LQQSQKNSESKIAMFQEAMRAGRKALGTKPFKEDVGEFWSMLETRPFMRALFGLAYELERAGKVDEAILQYQEVLRLNKGDNQGARYQLVSLLIASERLDEAMKLVNKYKDDVGPHITYNRALLYFKYFNDAPKTKHALDEAIRWNPHVVSFLLETKFNRTRRVPDSIIVGGEDEAYLYARECRKLWHKTDGIMDWLVHLLLSSHIELNKLTIAQWRGSSEKS
jgi:tetratricopeptide (TPR) repeat protein